MSKVRDIVKKAGGPVAVAKATSRTAYAVQIDAVFKWYRNGVPDRLWPLLIDMSGVTAQDLYEANCEARRSKRRSSAKGNYRNVAA